MKNLFYLFVFIFTSVSGYASNYYIDSTGSDANNGTSTSTPWKTITKFNSSFSGLSVGDSVLFKRGQTFYGTLIISRSGSSGSPIIIGAYGTGAKPIITGFTTISAWTSIGSGIYESNNSSFSNNLNMVTFQDTLQPMGRWPKLFSNDNGGYLIIGSHSGNASITSSDIASALSYVGGEIVQRKFQWIMDRARITAQTSTVVTYGQLVPENHTGGFDIDDPQDGHGFFFQNHVNACTILGEWAYDSTNKKIKMYFGGASTGSYSVKATTLDSLAVISSKSYITFDNIEFRGGNSKTIKIITSDHIQINSCDIKFSGVEGIYASSSATNNIQIYNCNISYTNNNAINANGASSMNIQNNTVNKTAVVPGAGLSCNGQYVTMSFIGGKSLIQYNTVKNSGFIGIHFVGDSVIVRRNLVDSFDIVKTDGGAIYAYGGGASEYGRKIIGNIVLHGIGNRFGIESDARTYTYGGDCTGIYMDGYASETIIDSNTVAFCDYNGFQVGGINNTVRYNTSYHNLASQFDLLPNGAPSPITGIIVKHNIFFARDPQSMVGIHFSYTGNTVSGWGTIDSNYYCRPINEPATVDTPSYVGANLGGIIQLYIGVDYRMKSLDKWQTISGQDAHTLKTYATVTDTSKIRFEYNATNSSVLVSLGTYAYKDVAGVSYQGTVNLPPYSSIILLNPVVATVNSTIFKGKRFKTQ